MNVVILHGWGQDSKFWESIAEKISINTLTLDMPGFGKKKLIDPNWGIPEYANWVINKIRRKNNIVLIGHSFGGRIAAEIASKKPKWLKGLILSGSPCLYRPTGIVKLKIKINKVLKQLLPKRFKYLFFTGDLKDAEARGFGKTFRKVVAYDQAQKLKKIDVHTLLIWGENDNSVPLRIAKEIKTLIKKSELKVIESAGHNSFLENPNLFYGYVKSYLKNI